MGRSCVPRGRDTRQEDVDGSPTQSRVSPSIRREGWVVLPPSLGLVYQQLDVRLRGTGCSCFFFPLSSLLLSSLELSDTKVYESYMRALLGIASQFCAVVVLKLRSLLADMLSHHVRQQGICTGDLPLGCLQGGVRSSTCGQLLHHNVKWFRRGLVFTAHRLFHHSTLGSGEMKKKKLGFRVWD